jgi:hypothetical protein
VGARSVLRAAEGVHVDVGALLAHRAHEVLDVDSRPP